MGSKPRVDVARPANPPLPTPPSLRDYLATNRSRLSKLPYFSSEVNPIETLEAWWGDGDIAKLFGDRLQGMAPVYRHMALDFLAANLREPGIQRIDGFVSGDTVVVCKGDLHVAGNLEVTKCVVVLGDLVVDRSVLLFAPGYPTLYVGGNLRCVNYFANEAETVCCGGIEASEAMVLIYNHTVTVASSLRANLLVTDDAFIDGDIEATKRSEGSDEDYKTLFGLEFDADEDDFSSEEHIHGPLIELLKSA